ncbi:MAG TPA: hypothetical protein VHW01_16440, partial [Polyangiaceae bacterium]|nr:hypothetical protein [Polyangiaceae bacterium]
MNPIIAERRGRAPSGAQAPQRAQTAQPHAPARADGGRRTPQRPKQLTRPLVCGARFAPHAP